MSNHFFCVLKIWIEWEREYQLYRKEDGRRRLKKEKRKRKGWMNSNGKVEKSEKKRQKGRGKVGGSVTNKVGNNKEKKSKKGDRMNWNWLLMWHNA